MITDPVTLTNLSTPSTATSIPDMLSTLGLSADRIESLSAVAPTTDGERVLKVVETPQSSESVHSGEKLLDLAGDSKEEPEEEAAVEETPTATEFTDEDLAALLATDESTESAPDLTDPAQLQAYIAAQVEAGVQARLGEQETKQSEETVKLIPGLPDLALPTDEELADLSLDPDALKAELVKRAAAYRLAVSKAITEQSVRQQTVQKDAVEVFQDFSSTHPIFRLGDETRQKKTFELFREKVTQVAEAHPEWSTRDQIAKVYDEAHSLMIAEMKRFAAILNASKGGSVPKTGSAPVNASTPRNGVSSQKAKGQSPKQGDGLRKMLIDLGYVKG